MSISLRRTVSLMMWAAVLAMPATASAQKEDESFRKGLSARDTKNWPEVVVAMREAIGINGKESTRKIGVRLGIFGGTEYLPHYFLGEALKNSNDCGGAVTAWEVSLDQKVVLGLKDYADGLSAGLKECAANGILLRDDFRTQTALTEQLYKETLDAFGRVGKLRDANQDLWRPESQDEYDRARNELAQAYKTLDRARQSRFLADFSESRLVSNRAAGLLRPLEVRLTGAISTRSLVAKQAAQAQQILADADNADREIDAAKVALPPDLASSREGARATLKGARERLGQAEKTQSTATAGDAVRLAQEASDAFGKVLDEVRRLVRKEIELRFQQLVAKAAEQFSFVGSSIATLERRVADSPEKMTPEMTSQRDALVKEYNTLLRRLDNARRTENAAGVEQVMSSVVETRGRIDALIEAFGPLSLIERGVDAALVQGSRNYLAGEYEQTLATLDPLAGRSDITLQLHVSLFRAASLHALYVRSGEKDQTLRNNALAAIQRCKEIDPGFTPDPRVFSPRFISFFQSGSASGTPAVAPSSQ